MSEVTLGRCPNATSERDAIHVAVIPMVASEMLRPGQRVGVIADGAAGPSADVVGIVDPYLTDVVPKGELFWLCLLPGTVTGMRHHWRHPIFDEGQPHVIAKNKMSAEAWLRKQCEPLGCSFDALVGDDSELVCAEWIYSPLNEDARDYWYEIKDEFWKQHEIYTGRETPEQLRGGFTCSC